MRPWLPSLFACLVLSCGGTEPNDGGGPPDSDDVNGVWTMAISNIDATSGTTGLPIKCIAEWIATIENEFLTVPYNATIRCDGGGAGIWNDRGMSLLVSPAGDSLAFLNNRLDTFAVAGFESASSLRGHTVHYYYPGGVFTATRRSGGDPNKLPWMVDLLPWYRRLEIGDTTPVVVQAYDAYLHQFTDPALEWSSSAPGVATVGANGVVRAIEPGFAIITARFGDAEKDFEVQVLTPPASIEITAVPDSLIHPANVELVGVARDAAGEILQDRRFHWTSSDPAVATVIGEQIAQVTTTGPGTVTITARSTTLSATANLTVLPEVAVVEVTGSPGTLLIGDSVRLSAVTRDAAGNVLTGRPVSWRVEDNGFVTSALTVSGTGLARARRGGRERILAQAEQAVGGLEIRAVMDAALTSVSSGWSHACGLTGTGRVYCWGLPSAGQLGPDHLDDAQTPVPIAAPQPFASVTAGGMHTCATTATGTTFCWGMNDFGQLGQPPGNPTGALQQVSGGVSFETLTIGNGFTCGLTAAGQAFCWGANTVGQLGRGTVTQTANPAPAPVAGGHAFTQLRAGPAHVCGLEADGDVWCWGTNEAGLLGLGDDDPAPRSTPVRAAPGLKFTGIAPGSKRTCGITTAGPVYCWGISLLEPTQLDNGTGYVKIVAGYQHHCRIDTVGMVTCWGDISDFGVGYHPTVPIADLTGGIHYSCAMPVSGRAFCWGLNDGWRLGEAVDGYGPVEIAGQP